MDSIDLICDSDTDEEKGVESDDKDKDSTSDDETSDEESPDNDDVSLFNNNKIVSILSVR